MTKKVMLSAVQPTNRLTLGVYLGAIKQWLKWQDQYSCYFFVVDLHAITVRQDPKILRERTLEVMANYLAAGIDPKHSVIFPQSAVSAHAELAWVLSCFSYMGELGRMTQYKDKSAKTGDSIPVGLFTYPVLMAADILLYGAEVIPVGADQKQHIELARDLVERFNNIYGPTFAMPQPIFPSSAARVMDLQNPTAKMSKSAAVDTGTVFLLDDPKEIEKKFKRAVTDSGTEITFDDSKLGVKNLLEIQSAITGKTPSDLVVDYSGKMYGHLKLDTADMVNAMLKPIREETQRYLRDKGELERIVKDSIQHARSVANKTMKLVYDKIGFLNY